MLNSTDLTPPLGVLLLSLDFLLPEFQEMELQAGFASGRVDVILYSESASVKTSIACLEAEKALSLDISGDRKHAIKSSFD